MLALGKFFVYVRQTRIVNRSFIIKLNAYKSAIVCKPVYVLSYLKLLGSMISHFQKIWWFLS